MKEFRSKNSGRFIFNEDIHHVQELALSPVEMFKDSGLDFVLSGCKVTVTERNGTYSVAVTSGYVFLNNRIRKVPAFSGTTAAINTIGIYETNPVAPQITYKNGDTDYMYDDYEAEVKLNFDNSDSLSCVLTTYSSNHYVFPNLRTAYFTHYALVNDGTPGHYPLIQADKMVASIGEFANLKLGGNAIGDLFVSKSGGNMNDGVSLTFTKQGKSTIITGNSIAVGGLLSANGLSINGNAAINGRIAADTIIKNGGTSTQFLKADGSIDEINYATADSLKDYLPIAGGTISGDLIVNGDLTVNKNVVITKDLAVQRDFSVSGLTTTQEINGTDIVLSGNLQAVNVTLSGDMQSNTAHIGDTNVTGILNVTGAVSAASAIAADGSITASSFIKNGGTANQFLKADGSIDTNTYATTNALNGVSSQLANYLLITGGTLSGSITSPSFIKSGGTSSQFLKADGSVDSNSYVTSDALNNYLPIGGGTMYNGDHYLTLQGGGITIGHLEGVAKLYLTPTDRFLGIQAGELDVNCNAVINGSVCATSFVKTGGTSSQFLKADGSVDNNNYATMSQLSNYATIGELSNYMRADGGTIYTGDHYITLRGNGITIGHLEGGTTLSVTPTDRYLGINNNTVVQGFVEATSFNSSSDINLKNRLADIILSAEDIANAPAIKFTWKSGGNKVNAGTIAQYWQEILPEVIGVSGGHLTMDYSQTAMVSVISLAKEVVALKKEIEQLRNTTN